MFVLTEIEMLVENWKEYIKKSSIEILKLICDKVFFYGSHQNQSIKNMLYGNQVFYQDFNKESMIESYLYRLINENQRFDRNVNQEFPKKFEAQIIFPSTDSSYLLLVPETAGPPSRS